MSRPGESSSPSEGSQSIASDRESEDAGPIETLVTGRARRVTAGNRLSSLVEKEQDDDLGLLFAEDEQEEDRSFDEDEGDASDADLSSSSDEDDKAGPRGDDELAGEKELEKLDRLEKRKRKAKEMSKLPGMRRKKVKIDPTAITATTPQQARPKKKSERVSWVATAADAPTRASSRKQTIQNREVIHQRLVNSEKHRKKIMRQMEEAQKKKDASKPKALTQAQRLEDAAKMERKNAHSLNRWEESEKKRLMEQKAKLEAMHNRQLTGPAISWWSGLTRWVNGKIAQSGVKEIRSSGHMEDPNKMQATTGWHESLGMPSQASTTTQTNILRDSAIPHAHRMPTTDQTSSQQPSSSYSQPVQFTTPQGPFGLLDGIHAHAALPFHQQDDRDPQHTSYGSAKIREDSLTTTMLKEPSLSYEYMSRNLVALKNVDANAQRLPEFQSSALLKRQKTRLPKPSPEPCAIRGQPSRYREPRTGLPYADSYAYKEIERLRKGGARWSNLLDCYVGSSRTVASGVPERFWKPA